MPEPKYRSHFHTMAETISFFSGIQIPKNIINVFNNDDKENVIKNKCENPKNISKEIRSKINNTLIFGEMKDNIKNNKNPKLTKDELILGKSKIIKTLKSLGIRIITSEDDINNNNYFIIEDLNKILFRIKVVSHKKLATIYLPENKFDINDEKLFLIYFIFTNDFNIDSEKFFIIPAKTWQNFKNDNVFIYRDYKGKNKKGEKLKSKPEWGINVSKKNMNIINHYKFYDKINEYMQTST